MTTRRPSVSCCYLNDTSKPTSYTSGPSIEVFGTLAVPEAIKHSLTAIREGFSAGMSPYLTEEGTSGCYILRDATGADEAENSRPVAVWKPIDEEPFAPNNPRGM